MKEEVGYRFLLGINHRIAVAYDGASVYYDSHQGCAEVKFETSEIGSSEVLLNEFRKDIFYCANCSGTVKVGTNRKIITMKSTGVLHFKPKD